MAPYEESTKMKSTKWISTSVYAVKFDLDNSLPKLVTGNCMIFTRNSSLECTFPVNAALCITQKTINITTCLFVYCGVGFDRVFFTF